jgi:hypothetical protein
MNASNQRRQVMALTIRPQQAWELWLSNGEAYEKAIGGRSGKPSPFMPAIQYNLVALALESYVMAMVHYHGSLPENHTFTDLVRAWETVAPLDPGIKATILKYEDMQSICSLDNYHRFEPSQRDVLALQAAVATLGEIVKKTCLHKRHGIG